jgi:pilus assembly protein CpaE
VVVVGNRVAGAGLQEVSRKDFETSIERKVDLVIPFEAKAAAQAAKLGQPLAKVAGPKIVQPLNQLVSLTLASVSDGEGSESTDGGSLLGKISNFKALIPKKVGKAEAA